MKLGVYVSFFTKNCILVEASANPIHMITSIILSPIYMHRIRYGFPVIRCFLIQSFCYISIMYASSGIFLTCDEFVVDIRISILGLLVSAGCFDRTPSLCFASWYLDDIQCDRCAELYYNITYILWKEGSLVWFL